MNSPQDSLCIRSSIAMGRKTTSPMHVMDGGIPHQIPERVPRGCPMDPHWFPKDLWIPWMDTWQSLAYNGRMLIQFP